MTLILVAFDRLNARPEELFALEVNFVHPHVRLEIDALTANVEQHPPRRVIFRAESGENRKMPLPVRLYYPRSLAPLMGLQRFLTECLVHSDLVRAAYRFDFVLRLTRCHAQLHTRSITF